MYMLRVKLSDETAERTGGITSEKLVDITVHCTERFSMWNAEARVCQ